jgi:hypothetical protein
MKRIWLLALVVAALAAEPARVFYSKSFPGSSPAYAAVNLDREGQADYREAPDADNPLKFQLSPKETEEIFALVEKLGKFTRPLESKLKVANTGVKTFRYQSGSETHEVQFNYSLDADARLLLDWFERISETQRYLIKLERSARYDRLGVHQALLELEAARDRNRLVAPQQFLKVLDRIAKSESYLHMARARAASLAESFRAGAAGNQQQ